MTFSTICAPVVEADTPPDSIRWSAELTASAGTGVFAPYYFTANRHGIITQSSNALADLCVTRDLNLSQRFSWSAGVEMLSGWSSSSCYARYTPSEGWTEMIRRPSSVILRQLYASAKWRGVFVTVGVRERNSAMLDTRLSSGDLIESGNARAIPEGRIGFVDFQNIPLTNGWVQLQGEAGYGRFTDADWITNHSNLYNGHVSHGSWLNYKRWYFRTKPSMPLSVIVGAQCVCVFGGTTFYYKEGYKIRAVKHSAGIKDFIEAFLPIHKKEDFRLGNTIGSWDLKANYNLKNGSKLSAYFQWPWEDGSGLGRRNGWDGLWGVEYKSAARGWIDGVVVEYLDLTNQSGPLHWSPDDRPGTTIISHATGADDYYNNAYYNSYANYGMAIGTPMAQSPIFNTDGYMQFLITRMRGGHIAAEGHPADQWDWRVAANYRKGWGSGKIALMQPRHSLSLLIEAGYQIKQVYGLEVRITAAADRGSLTGDNVGAQITVRYTGAIKLKK